MKTIFSFLFAVFLLPAAAMGGPPVAPADSATFQIQDESDMTVYGSSNVRDWSMDVNTMSGHAVFSTDERGTPSIHQITVEVPVKALVTDRSSMQEKAHKALQKEDHPTVQFTADSVVVATAEADSFAVIATGDLTIAGETRPATVRAKGAARGDGAYYVRGEHELKLSTFDVDRPSALLGALRVSDGIRLAFEVVLRQ